MFQELTKKNKPPIVVAEISANHNGSLQRAFDTISAAKKYGANAVKIQTYTADTMTLNCNKRDFLIKKGLWKKYKMYDLYKLAETPYEWHPQIFDHAKKIGIQIFSTPFDKTAVDLLERLNTPLYKIASFELVDLPLIRYVAQTKKPILFSTGMATKNEIQEAIHAARSNGCQQVALLHCISNYPTPLHQAHLLAIPELKKRFQVPVGLSDHTLGSTAAVVGVALGARIIEKHFTLSRKNKGPDTPFSLEPKELQKLCHKVRDAWEALGENAFQRPPAEKENKIFRRSIYFVKSLPKGTKITAKDIRCIRPGMGLHPKYFEKVIRMKTKKHVNVGTRVLWTNIQK